MSYVLCYNELSLRNLICSISALYDLVVVVRYEAQIQPATIRVNSQSSTVYHI